MEPFTHVKHVDTPPSDNQLEDNIDTRNNAADIVNRYTTTSRFILVNWGKKEGNPSIEVINGDNRLYEIILE